MSPDIADNVVDVHHHVATYMGGVLIFRGTPKASLDKLGLSKNGGTPIPGWILVENPMKMDDLGVPHGTPPFQETSI